MIIKPIPLIILIIVSFCLMLITNNGADKPLTDCGIVFWLSFGVFAFCCIHLSKNEKYYKKL